MPLGAAAAVPLHVFRISGSRSMAMSAPCDSCREQGCFVGDGSKKQRDGRHSCSACRRYRDTCGGKGNNRPPPPPSPLLSPVRRYHRRRHRRRRHQWCLRRRPRCRRRASHRELLPLCHKRRLRLRHRRRRHYPRHHQCRLHCHRHSHPASLYHRLRACRSRKTRPCPLAWKAGGKVGSLEWAVRLVAVWRSCCARWALAL